MISIRAPRTGRDARCYCVTTANQNFNPRAPHGARRPCCSFRLYTGYFNPRAPHGARRRPHDRSAGQYSISIRAPRTGRDTMATPAFLRSLYFNPRAPHGARRHEQKRIINDRNFNPRAPHGARLGADLVKVRSLRISIRAPRTGRDSKNAQIVLHFFNNSQPKIEIQRPAQAGRAI